MGTVSLAIGFGSPQNWAILAVVALIVFGPKRLPELDRQLGQAMREFSETKARMIAGTALKVNLLTLLVALILSSWLGLSLTLAH